MPKDYTSITQDELNALPTDEKYEASYDYLYAQNAFEGGWAFPEGPWGWNEDGTSKAPTPFLSHCHVSWYHDMRETRGE